MEHAQKSFAKPIGSTTSNLLRIKLKLSKQKERARKDCNQPSFAAPFALPFFAITVTRFRNSATPVYISPPNEISRPSPGTSSCSDCRLSRGRAKHVLLRSARAKNPRKLQKRHRATICGPRRRRATPEIVNYAFIAPES